VSGGFLDKEISKSMRKNPSANIVKELVTWKINVLISILVNIVARKIIQWTDAPNETNLQD
jgi:hypothetical protein